MTLAHRLAVLPPFPRSSLAAVDVAAAIMEAEEASPDATLAALAAGLLDGVGTMEPPAGVPAPEHHADVARELRGWDRRWGA